MPSDRSPTSWEWLLCDDDEINSPSKDAAIDSTLPLDYHWTSRPSAFTPNVNAQQQNTTMTSDSPTLFDHRPYPVIDGVDHSQHQFLNPRLINNEPDNTAFVQGVSALSVVHRKTPIDDKERQTRSTLGRLHEKDNNQLAHNNSHFEQGGLQGHRYDIPGNEASGSGNNDRHFEKNHDCSICDMKFRYPKDLRRHERIHSGEKDFFCPYIECIYAFRGFPLKDSMERRLRTVH